MSAFDPYHKWLGIPADEQPPHHYRLLGIEPLESDPDVIEAAADRQMAFLRQVSTGRHAAEAQRLLNEIAAARLCLLSAAQKQKYDEQLRARFPPAAPVAEPPPSEAPHRRVVHVAQAAPLARAAPLAKATPLPALPVAPRSVAALARRKRASIGVIAVVMAAAVLPLAAVGIWLAMRPSGPTPTTASTGPRPGDIGSSSQTNGPSPAQNTANPPIASPPQERAPTEDPLQASQPPPSSVVGATPTSAAGDERTGAPRADPNLICQVLDGKRQPVGVTDGVIAFAGPDGDGRRGASGLYVPPERIASGTGTEWRFEYQRGGTARGVQMIHPLGDGHVVATLMIDGAGVVAGGRWTGYFRPQQGLEERLDAYHAEFPFEPAEPHEIVSRLLANGYYMLYLDGKPLIRCMIADAKPLVVTEKFVGEGLPSTWPPGSAGLLIGPLDDGVNRAQSVRLTAIRSAEAPSVASTAPKGLSSPSPSPSTPPQGAAPAARTPHTVWEVFYARYQTSSLELFDDGTTREYGRWKQSGSRLEFDALADVFTVTIQPDGFSFLGESRFPEYATGRLRYKGVHPITEAAGEQTVSPRSEMGDRVRGKLADWLPDVFELTGTSRQKRYLRLTTVLTADGAVQDGASKLAGWELDGGKLKLKFVDPKLGEAALNVKSLSEMTGRSKAADGDEWTWNLQRVQLVSVWDTGSRGRLALYSNGRVLNDSLAGMGYWSNDAGKLRIMHYACTIAANGATFLGRGPRGEYFSGKRVPNSVMLAPK